MFRYLALAWDEAVSNSTACARQLGLELMAKAEWRTVVHRPGLQVFATGMVPGVNGVHRLPLDRGVVLGKLFRRRDLGTSSRGDLTMTVADGQQIVDSRGDALVSDFWGRYIAFLQAPSGSTCVLRDPSGTLPCFVIRHEGVAIVFSWLEDALALSCCRQPPSVNWDALDAYLRMGDLAGRETALEGVTQILPAERADLQGGGSTFLWDAVTIAQAPTTYSAEDAAQQLKDVVRACAQSWASCYETILFRLSGGVDSSILLSCLSPDRTPADVICVNYHSEGSDSDERRFARLAAAHAGRDLIERERDPSFRIDRILEIARTPIPVPYIGWMNAATDARLARAHGATAMFTGTGGDPLFFEYRRWWPAADYLRVRGPDRRFIAAALDAARLGNVSVWKTVSNALMDRVRPDLAARESWNNSPLLGPTRLDKPTVLERFLHPSLVRDTGLPIGKFMQTRALMQAMGYYDPFEQAAAPELVTPLLSQPLVELCLALPTYVLTQGGRGRALARHAFASELPAQIATRRSKGGMEEHVADVLLRNLDFARTLLIEGELARRGMLGRARVEETLSGRPTAFAGHFGQIHSLMAVEGWLGRWSAPQRPPA